MKILGIVCGCMAVIMLGIIVCLSYLDVMEMGLYPPAIMFVLYMTLFAFVFICNSKNTK